MALTTAYSGSVQLAINLQNLFSGDRDGTESAAYRIAATLAASGGTAPTISGFLKGDIVAAAGDILLAHATDPFGTMGDSVYSTGFTVASSKLKLFYFEHTDTSGSNTITIARKASTGLPIFDTAGDSITLSPGDWICRLFKAGTAALTTGSNDALTISVSAGSPGMKIICAYGP